MGNCDDVVGPDLSIIGYIISTQHIKPHMVAQGYVLYEARVLFGHHRIKPVRQLVCHII